MGLNESLVNKNKGSKQFPYYLTKYYRNEIFFGGSHKIASIKVITLNPRIYICIGQNCDLIN